MEGRTRLSEQLHHRKSHSSQPFDESAWELYNLNEDFTERIDLAKKYPEKLAELKALFEDQAKSHHLYPYITWDDVFNGRIHRTPGARGKGDPETATNHLGFRCVRAQ